MAGREESLGNDWDSDGIIPRSVEYMWDTMTHRPEQFYVKAAYLEIYKEQLMDLLNTDSGILHARWNV